LTRPQVNVTFVGPGRSIPPADVIVLPGSQSVISDLAWLKQQGFSGAIQRHLRYGGKVLGIGGGQQMLGEWIDDPDGVEGTPSRTRGLGLLALTTRLAAAPPVFIRPLLQKARSALTARCWAPACTACLSIRIPVPHCLGV
jgi:cobyric acid synthase